MATMSADARQELFARIMRGEAATPTIASAPIGPRAPGARVPLSPAQRQVWLHAAMAPDAALYNESITIHRLGPLDFDALQASFDAFLGRHESWRTSFAFEGAEPGQVIHPGLTVPIERSDVSHLPPDMRDHAAVALATADAARPIDLSRPPLLRARLVRMGPEEHRLYLTLHHIIFDGVSIYRVVLPELAQLYESAAGRHPAPLPPPRIGYGDYAVWRAEQPCPATERQLGYWRGALAGRPPKLELIGDRAPAAVPTHAGSMEVFGIPAELIERLKDMGRRHGATLYMTLLAAFKAMLHRYTGAEDVVVGGVTDLRRRPELERVVGYFLNTIALRSRPRGEAAFADYLAEVRDAVLGALAASEVPFDEVVRALDVRAEPGTHPLFDILFSVEPPTEPFPPGWDLTQMDVTVGAAKFALYLELDERPDGMAGRFLYSTERFDAGTIRRMIDHWLAILHAVAADPDCPLSDLPLVTAGSRSALVAPPVPRQPPLVPLPEAVAARAQATPDAPAIRCGALRWSYAELDAAATRIAERLRAAGQGRGSLVAIAMDRSPMLVAGLLGILRAGAAYLPLDPDLPAVRLDQIVADAAPDALLTESALRDHVPLRGRPVLLADATERARERRASPPPPDPGDLAYVIYTSGSTGRPKGVEIEHRALANLLAAMADAPGFTADDTMLAITTVSFDIAALELFLPLAAGGEVVLAPSGAARDPAALAALVDAVRPTVMQATPATWHALVEAGWRGDPAIRLLCGGEALSRALATRLCARSAELWNLYGPTETTVWSTAGKVDAGAGPVPIGGPIADTRLHVLDRRGRPVPPGVAGELHIGGAGLARGYRNRPDLTAERFVPCAAVGEERLYRTGDLVREGTDGALVHIGRIDHEEKIRGFRVAVEEVEAALAGHPDVAAAAVRSWPDEGTGTRALAGYVVPVPGREPSAAALRSHVAERLPDYMVPSAYVSLPALPMTSSGKVDRKALPQPHGQMLRGGFAAPAGEGEERLASLWAELLGCERIGRDDSFFELGGHSLLVAHLLARVETAFGCRIGMAAFFRAHRLKDMARILAEDGMRTPADGAGIRIQPDGWRPPLIWIETSPGLPQLARKIGRDQPVIGIPLQPAGCDGARDFRAHAREIVDLIRAVRPHGPYYLAGWCVAGIIALEAAAQLRAAGEEVPLLLLGDTFNPAALARDTPLRLMRKLWFHGASLLSGEGGARTQYLRERGRDALIRLRLRPPRPHWSGNPARAALDAAARGYRPVPYHGNVLLFRARDEFDSEAFESGWDDVLRGAVDRQSLPGRHDTLLFPPHVDRLAAVLRAALVDAQERAAAPEIARDRSLLLEGV